MADDSALPILPPDEIQPWLARNRKLVILGGVALILLIAAAVTYFGPRPPAESVNTTPVAATNNSAGATNNVSTINSAPPTYQRAAVTNVATAPPTPYQLPTADQLKQAIDKLRLINAPSP